MNYALTALLVFCLIAWGFVLVPPAVRLLSGVIRPSDSIGTFRNKMAVLAGSTPQSYLGQPTDGSGSTAEAQAPASAPTPVPALAASTTSATTSSVLHLAAHRATRPSTADLARRRAAKRRRRNVFTGLLASVPVTFLLGLLLGGPAWALFLLSAAAFAGYTFLLWQMQQTALERARKVAVLPTTAQPVEATGDVRRISLVAR